MEQPFTRADLAGVEIDYLNRGRWGNADLYRFRLGGREWVAKDFRHCPWPVRWTWGAFMVSRELLALSRLEGIPGIPQHAFRLDRLALCYEFMPGQTLREAPGSALTPAFFEKLEEMVRRMHARGVVHLDIRYWRNVLVLADGSPGLIDFQAHVGLKPWYPAFVRRWLEEADLSGVYKHWCKRHPDSITEDRVALMKHANRRRKFWILKGYGIRIKPIGEKDYEQVKGKESS